MKLHKIEIKKTDLLLVPEKERTFFVQATYLLGEINILNRMMIFSINDNYADGSVLKKAQTCQSMFFVVTQAGKLFEGWELISKKFFGTKISQEYEKKLSPNGKNSLGELKIYFNKKNNVLSEIRNKFAFHYFPSSEEIQKQIAQISESETLELFIAEHHGNCLYYISSVLVLEAVAGLINSENKKAAVNELFEDTIKIGQWFLNFLGDLVLIIAQKYFAINKSEKIEIQEPIKINEVSLPYFTSRPD